MSQADRDDVYMRRALALARFGQARGGSPIGAVLVIADEIVAEGYNEVAATSDATAHAEIVAIRRLGAKLQQSRFHGAALYSTLQPCGMCTMASIWAHISRIVYGAGSADVHKMYFEDRHVRTLKIIDDAYRDDISVVGGVLRDDCSALYHRPWDKVPLSEQANI